MARRSRWMRAPMAGDWSRAYAFRQSPVPDALLRMG
jgi:hypothetical protein